MDTKGKISKEVTDLVEKGVNIYTNLLNNKDKKTDFQFEYQRWYTQALRVVNVLAPDRYAEFKSYYEIDPKRKSLNYGTYVIQDYLKGVIPNIYSSFDSHAQALQCFSNQLTIFSSMLDLIDSLLANIDDQLLFGIQDTELRTAEQLMKVNIRAAGSLAGVVIESHLQKMVKNHGIVIRKKNPTINDLNERLKNDGIFDTPTWRKITYLADIRNTCSHKKDAEPKKEQVSELINGANWLIKNVF